MSECQTKAGNQECFEKLSLSLLSLLSLLPLLSLFHSLYLDMLNNFCFNVYAQKSLTLSHSFNLSFTHSRHAEQLLFSCLCSKLSVYSRKLQLSFCDDWFDNGNEPYFKYLDSSICLTTIMRPLSIKGPKGTLSEKKGAGEEGPLI